MKIKDLQGKNIAILGFGKEGLSTFNFLIKNKIKVQSITILDQKTGLSVTGAEAISGDKYLNHLDKYDIIFKSPGIPMAGKLEKHKEKITSQTQLFFDNYNGKVIGVTASKGKSTISSLCYHIIQNAGYRVKLVGNIGTAVLNEIDLYGNQTYDYVVYELSSYMLHDLHKKNYISILGSIFPDHLDWHGSMKKYVEAKLNILKGSEINIINYHTIKKHKLGTDMENIISYGGNGNYSIAKGSCLKNGKKLFRIKSQLLGEHNQENIIACIALAQKIGISNKVIKKNIKTFQGLEHRLQYVGKYKKIYFYDDSISTTPESTIQAIKALGNKLDTIFLGGTDRGYNFKELISYIKKYSIKNIVLFPESGHRIKKLLSSDYRILETRSMEEAVRFAFHHTKRDSICLLSTASPSYSIWESYEEKGDLFQKGVKDGYTP